MDDFYYILGIESSSSNQEIKKAYRKLSKKLHPDIDPGNLELEEKFKTLQLAYSVLKDPVKKKVYDGQLEANKNRYEHSKTYTRNIRPVHAVKADSVGLNNIAFSRLLGKRFKRKDIYHICVALSLILIAFSVIIFLERKVYSGVHYVEPPAEAVKPVPLIDSVQFIHGFNDSISIKAKPQPSSFEKN